MTIFQNVLLPKCGLVARNCCQGGTPHEERLLEEGGSQAWAASNDDEDGARKPQIWAGIVTYNPCLERLNENLSAIITQVQTLAVFDNGSSNVGEIRKVLTDAGWEGRRICLIESNENKGLAVALNRLANAAHEAGAEAIVFLDQDSVAGTNLVAALAKHMQDGVAVVSPLVVDRNNARVAEDRSIVRETKRPLTSGSMVNIAAWTSIGGYDERYFVDWVDVDFCDNLRMHGYRLLITHETILLHELGNQEFAWFGPGTDYTGKRSASRGYYRLNYPAWRWCDRARGQAIAMRKYAWTRIGIEERLIFLKTTVGRALLIERDKKACLFAIFEGLREGRRAMQGEPSRR